MDAPLTLSIVQCSRCRYFYSASSASCMHCPAQLSDAIPANHIVTINAHDTGEDAPLTLSIVQCSLCHYFYSASSAACMHCPGQLLDAIPTDKILSARKTARRSTFTRMSGHVVFISTTRRLSCSCLAASLCLCSSCVGLEAHAAHLRRGYEYQLPCTAIPCSYEMKTGSSSFKLSPPLLCLPA